MPDRERRLRSKEVACPVEFCGAGPSQSCVDIQGWVTAPHMRRVLAKEKINEDA